MTKNILKKFTVLLTIFSAVILMSNTAIANDEPGSFAEECQVVYDTTGFIWPGCEDLIDFGDSGNDTETDGGVGEGGDRCRRNPGVCTSDQGGENTSSDNSN